MAQLFDASGTWEVRDPYPPQASDREPAITLPSLQVVPGALESIPKAFVAPFFSVEFSRSVVSDSETPWTACSMPGFPVHHQLSEPTVMPPLIL